MAFYTFSSEFNKVILTVTNEIRTSSFHHFGLCFCLTLANAPEWCHHNKLLRVSRKWPLCGLQTLSDCLQEILNLLKQDKVEYIQYFFPISLLLLRFVLELHCPFHDHLTTDGAILSISNVKFYHMCSFVIQEICYAANVLSSHLLHILLFLPAACCFCFPQKITKMENNTQFDWWDQ